MTNADLLATLHNTQTLLEAEQQRRQTAEANFESCNQARRLAEKEVDRLRAAAAFDSLLAPLDSAEIIALRIEVDRLRKERRSLWKFVKPVEGVQLVYLGVHAVRWYEAAGEYKPTAGFIQANYNDEDKEGAL